MFCREAVYECEGRVFPSYQETPAAYVILKRRDLQLQVSESVNNRLCVYKAAITVLFSPLLCHAREGGFLSTCLRTERAGLKLASPKCCAVFSMWFGI